MKFLKDVASSILGSGIKEIAGGVTDLALGIRSAITGETDPRKKAELEKLILEADILQRKMQTEINKAESLHISVFVAGARPFIMWVCGFGVAYNFLVHPLIIWGVLIAGINIPEPPMLRTEELMTLLLALLGLGGLRTYEKCKKVQDRH